MYYKRFLFFALYGYIFINLLIFFNPYDGRFLNIKHLYKEKILSYVSCRSLSYQLQGDLVIRDIRNDSVDVLESIARENPNVSNGGYFSPRVCNSSAIPKDSVAIIVPFRDRHEHLLTYLQHMHPFLTRQGLEYQIYVINQGDGAPFNRGKLINIGYKEAMKDRKWKCIIMHDVDYLPLNDNNFYICRDQPYRLIVANSEYSFKYGAPYKHCFGGVAAIKPEQFETVNGFFNEYYGWGAEDDDLAKRMSFNGLHVGILDEKEGMRVGKYQMLSHKPAEPAKDRIEKLQKVSDNWAINGVNTSKYEILSRVENALYTNITVDLLYKKT